MTDLSEEAARAVIEAVVVQAVAMNVSSNIAVVDSGCNLKSFLRMDGALLGSSDIAVRKARTAGLFDMNTEELGPLAAPGGALAGIGSTNDGLVTFGGGTPIHDEGGRVIGAVGVSGSSVENDTLLAGIGAKAAH